MTGKRSTCAIWFAILATLFFTAFMFQGRFDEQDKREEESSFETLNYDEWAKRRDQ